MGYWKEYQIEQKEKWAKGYLARSEMEMNRYLVFVKVSII
jgi:hypothetical protein